VRGTAVQSALTTETARAEQLAAELVGLEQRLIKTELALAGSRSAVSQVVPLRGACLELRGTIGRLQTEHRRGAEVFMAVRD
jgi:hypothetical protein